MTQSPNDKIKRNSSVHKNEKVGRVERRAEKQSGKTIRGKITTGKPSPPKK